MHDDWPTFKIVENQDQEKQSGVLNQIFPEGKSLALTFAPSKETFPETRRNFMAVLASHPELKWRLVKEFWYAGQKIYEVYEVDRPRRTELHHVAPQNPLAQLVNRLVVIPYAKRPPSQC